MERRSLAFRAEDVAPDGSSFAGWGSAFFTIDSYGSIIAPNAFDRTLQYFLDKGFVGGLNHDWNCPIGAPVEAKCDATKGLWVKGELVPTEAGKQAQILLAHKLSTGRPVIQSLSIGFDVLSSTDCRTADPVKAFWDRNGYTPSDADNEALALGIARFGIRIFKDVRLYEVSPVTVPANALAEICEARAGKPRGARNRHEIDAELRLKLALAGLSA
ncbi:MAG: HK97 family phage prohead protease [Isosphaeraceae bacterium]